MNQNPEDLLNTNSIMPKERHWVSWLIVGVLFLGATLVLWVVYLQNPQEGITEAQKQGLERGAQIAKFYELDSKSVGTFESAQEGLTLQDGAGDAQPTGIILMSARNIRGVVDEHIKTYVLNLENAETPFQTLIDGVGLSAMAEPRTKENTNELFILGSTLGQGDPDSLGVFTFTRETEVLTQYFGAMGLRERNFAWSEAAGLLALNRMKSGNGAYNEMLPITNWEIALLNPVTDSVDTVIPDAWRAQWLPDGKTIVYLKADGLYAMRLETKEEVRLVGVPEGGLVTALAMVGVSPDGSQLVWTTAKAGIIRIFSLENGEQIVATERARIENPDMEYYWPTFSPTGEFYVVQAIDKLKGDDLYRQNPRFEIRHIGYKEPVHIHSLAQFNFDELFTTAWVEAL